MQVEESAAGHNAVYRSYDLTDAYNSGEFSKWIASGKFTNIFPGCYIRKTKTIDGITYTDHIDIIVECDPYYGKFNGSNDYVTTHHVGLVPYGHLGSSYMNISDTSVKGFAGSYMYNSLLPRYLNSYKTAYGSDHFLKFGTSISTSIDLNANSLALTDISGIAASHSWYVTEITLLTEVQAFGSIIWSAGYDIGEGCSQFAAFRFNTQLLCFENNAWWLRGISSKEGFVIAGANGDAYYGNSSQVFCVRPLTLLK